MGAVNVTPLLPVQEKQGWAGCCKCLSHVPQIPVKSNPRRSLKSRKNAFIRPWKEDVFHNDSGDQACWLVSCGEGSKGGLSCYFILLMGFYLWQQIQELLSYRYCLILWAIWYLFLFLFIICWVHLAPFPEQPALYLRWILWPVLAQQSEQLTQL